MNRARDRKLNDPTYLEWQREFAAEQAATPEAQFKRAADADAEVKREIVLTKELSSEYMSGFGKPDFGFAKDDVAVMNAIERFTAQSDYVRSRKNSAVLVEFVLRNGLNAATVESYNIAHAILKLWNGYKDEVTPVETAPVVEQPVLSRSDQAIVDHQTYMDTIVGTDELGKSWTAYELDQLPAKDELRLRRLFEKGHRGSSLFDIYREIRDIKQLQDAERERIVAEGDQR